MSSPRAATVTAPPATALDQARARRQSAERWLRPIGMVVVIVVTWAAFGIHPQPGLAGRHLAVSVALAGFALGGLGALATRQRRGAVHLALVLVVLVSSAAAVFLQPGGVPIVGLFLALFLLVRLVPRRFDLPLTIAGAACLAATAVLSSRGSAVSGLFGALAVVGFFAMTVLARRLREANEQAEVLVGELERTRAAEAKAAGLAERQRLAREMHDVLAHSLSGLMLQLEGARMLAAEDPADPRLARAIERAHHLGSAGLDEASRAIGMLRGDELPGPERLAGLAARFSADSGVPCQFTVSGRPRELDSQTRLAVYRVVQEALTNITKHASPQRVEVGLNYEPGATRVTVQDFSAGGPPALAGGHGSGGYGLTGMRERAELLGGHLTAEPTGSGFRVELAVPWSGPAAR
jgi:signal transduction histidine kinase